MKGFKYLVTTLLSTLMIQNAYSYSVQQMVNNTQYILDGNDFYTGYKGWKETLCTKKDLINLTESSEIKGYAQIDINYIFSLSYSNSDPRNDDIASKYNIDIDLYKINYDSSGSFKSRFELTIGDVMQQTNHGIFFNQTKYLTLPVYYPRGYEIKGKVFKELNFYTTPAGRYQICFTNWGADDISSNIIYSTNKIAKIEKLIIIKKNKG
ncbi:MAG: hypothetical protein K2X69_15380 [Silvanigrellaceae bacterium]|nr:hypothetical protein [Silvanigrellaceae bacterium]